MYNDYWFSESQFLHFVAPMHDVSIDVSYADAENIGVNCSTRIDREAPYKATIDMNGSESIFDGTQFGSHSDCSVGLFWFGTIPLPANFTSILTNPIFKCKIEYILHNSTREATQEFIISRGIESTTASWIENIGIQENAESFPYRCLMFENCLNGKCNLILLFTDNPYLFYTYMYLYELTVLNHILIKII